MFCSVLFCSVLFCSVLFFSVLFCSVLFCSVLFCSVLFCSVLFCSVLFCSVLLCSVLLCSVLFCSVLFCSVRSCPVLSCPVLSCPVLSCPVLSYPVLFCSNHELVSLRLERLQLVPGRRLLKRTKKYKFGNCSKMRQVRCFQKPFSNKNAVKNIMEAANRFRRILASTVEKLHQISDNSQATKGETSI
jgi:hypothetical protein